MLVQSERALEVLEAKFTNVELGEVGVVRWVGGGVPCLNLICSKLDHLQLVAHQWLFL